MKQHGLNDILKPIYLQHFIDSIKAGTEPRKAIIFTTLDIQAEINDFLIQELGKCKIIKDPNTVPWVVNNSVAGDVTSQEILRRSKIGNIYCWVTSAVSLMGLNFTDIDYVITTSPFRQHHSTLQAIGRSGRLLPDGSRNVSVLYALYNRSSIREGLQDMDPSVTEFYNHTGCLKEFMHKKFSQTSFSKPANLQICCSNCFSPSL